MPATITTNNPHGIGYQRGNFSGTPGEPIDQQFFNAAFAGRINENKIYKESYHCNVVQMSNFGMWLDEFGDTDTDGYTAYSLIETYGDRKQMKISADATIPQYPATVALHIHDNDTYVNNQFILPQVGNTLLAPPYGHLLKVISINQASANDITVTVQQRDTTGNIGEFPVKANDEFLVFSGSEIADCQCPTGQFSLPDMPVITDLEMIAFGDKGELCGDAALKAQWLKIPFTDEAGKVYEHWYTEALQKMYQRFEERKFYEKLFNPKFGLIPILRARALKWVPASADEITIDDVRYWKKQLNIYGIGCTEFAIFAGRDKFSQFQRMLNTAGVTNLQYNERPMNDCAWINLEYCGIKVEGLTLHIYEESNFSNGKLLGSQNMVFPNSAIIFPMCSRPAATRGLGSNRGDSAANLKMFSTVYFKDNLGRVYESLTDSNGMFGPRNTFGAGCKKHEWTIETRFVSEVHCADWWGYMGL